MLINAICTDQTIAHLLISHGARINARMASLDGNGWTALHESASCPQYYETLEILVHAGALLSVSVYPWGTPLRLAVKCRNLEAVKIFLENGDDVHQLDSQGRSLLFDAVFDKSIFELLLNYGINASDTSPSLRGRRISHGLASK